MATMRKKNKATKMKLSERVKPRAQEESLAEIAAPDAPSATQPSTGQPIKSSTAAARASVERDNSSVAIKLMEASTDAQEDAINVDKKLLKAVSDLTKTMQFGYKRAQEEKKKGIGGYVQGKIASVKSAFTLEGMAGMAGIGRDDGTLKGAVLSSVLQRREKSQEDKTKKAEYIAKFGEFTERGRQLKETGGMEAVTAEGEERYKKLTAAERDISELEEKQKEAKAFNGTLSESDTEKLVSAQNIKKQVTDYSAAKKPLGGESQEDLLIGVTEGIKDEISKLMPEEKEKLNKADPEYLKGVFEGALGSLTEINEKQLDQLVSLVRLSTMSEEDKLESKGKENILTSIQDPKEDKKKEEGGSIMDTVDDTMDLIDDVMDLFGKGKGKGKGAAKAAKNLKGMIPKGALGAAAGTAAAGAVMLGVTNLFDTGLGELGVGRDEQGQMLKTSAEQDEANWQKATMVEKVQSALPRGIEKVGDFLGFENIVSQARSERVKSETEYLKKKEAGVEPTFGEKAAAAANESLVSKVFPMVGAIHSVAKISEMFSEAPAPEKMPTPNRVAQAVELAQNKEQLDMAEKEKKEAVSQPIVTNAPTTIVNNSSTTMVRPPIRNTDSSYNNRLERNFV